jgi:ribosomal protein S18 acetylase RimI-like enzyme
VAAIRIVDIRDAPGFALIPPCADPAFDHRSCDYWEDADRGSKAHRTTRPPAVAPQARPALADNPFAPAVRGPAFNPFAAADDAGEDDNPFLPRTPRAQATPPPDAPRKMALLTRGIAIFGSYAKVLLLGDVPAAYCQFGPLSAYPRALRLRELYPRLPDAPLPAVITCIATTPEARDQGLATTLVGAVCDDLGRRGFAAVEAYPDVGSAPDATSAATPAFWESAGFGLAAADDRFPVYRRELE